MGMDEDTGIDVGDFLAFYTGSMESCKVTSVAEITKVSFPKGNDLEQEQIEYGRRLQDFFSC